MDCVGQECFQAVFYGFHSVPQYSLSVLSPELGPASAIARHTGGNVSVPLD